MGRQVSTQTLVDRKTRQSKRLGKFKTLEFEETTGMRRGPACSRQAAKTVRSFLKHRGGQAPSGVAK